MKRFVWVICLCGLFLAASESAASTSITKVTLYTDNRPSVDPFGLNTGPSFHIEVTVSDPLGVPGNILSVQASGQPGENYTLAYMPNYHDFQSITPYNNQSGQYTIQVENLQHEIITANVTANLPQELLPLPTGLKVNNSSRTPTFSFAPVTGASAYRLTIFDANKVYVTKYQASTPTFKIPSGVLTLNKMYYLRAEAYDSLANSFRRSIEFLQFRPSLEPVSSIQILLE